MNIKRFIEILSAFNPEAEIVIDNSTKFGFGWNSDDNSKDEENILNSRETTEQVFIDTVNFPEELKNNES